MIGPNVFRFEYYYLLKNGLVTDVPWDQALRSTQTSLTSPVSIGLVDVEAIGVAIAAVAAPRLDPLLFQESPRDPVVFALVAGALLVVSAAASWLPRCVRLRRSQILTGGDCTAISLRTYAIQTY